MSDDVALFIGIPLLILIVGYFVLPDAIVDMFIVIFVGIFKAVFGF